MRGLHARCEAEAMTNRPDPTKMKNQPALQTSNGLIWLVMGGLFALVALVPFVLIAVNRAGGQQSLAIVVIVAVLSLYVAMWVVRFTTQIGPLRLRAMAGCMLAM